MARYQAVRGTFDVLPTDMPLWHKLEGTARDLAPRFGYQEIRTPLFEEADLFTRGMGVMAGLIEKELWTFKDKFGQKLALRTDATTGIIRAYQQNKLYNSTLPLKVFYLAPVFLLGKEGDERSRQSHQFGFEAIGGDNPALDAEVISMACAFCEELGIEDYTVRLNSLGGKDCRPPYLQKLRDYFGANVNQLCSTCKRKYKANPDWVLSCEEPDCKHLAQVAPTIFGMLTNHAKESFNLLLEYVEEMDLPVELDPSVVRDCEYYNYTVFEIRAGGKSLGFGGRYDNLVEKLGGKSTPAVGFAFSLETVLEVLRPTETETTAPPHLDVLLRPEGPESAKLLVPLLYTLRQRGISAELDYTNGRRSKDHPLAFSYLVSLDESNAFRGTAILHDTEDNSEEKVPVHRLRNRVLHVAGVSGDDEKDGSKSGRKKLKRGRRRSEEDKSEKKDSERSTRSEDSDSRSRRSRRTRKSTSSEERDRDSKRSSSRSSSSRSSSSSSSSSSRSSSSRSLSPEKESASPKESRSSRGRSAPKETKRDSQPVKAAPAAQRESSADQGKALVPAFNLGGAPSSDGKTATVKKKSSPKKAVRKKKTVASTSSTGGGLNWSIMPGKEGT